MSNETENALDRLDRLNSNTNEREFTLEEQMESVSTDDFLDGMSLAAKDQMSHLIEEVDLDDEDDTEDETAVQSNTDEKDNNNASINQNATPLEESVNKQIETTNDELFINNSKPKRKYERRNKSENIDVNESTINSESNPVFDQLVKDLIDDLRKRNYKINRFDEKSMNLIFNYMYNKF